MDKEINQFERAALGWEDENKKFTIKLLSKYSNPKDYKNFIGNEEKGFFPIEGNNDKYATKEIKFDMELPNKANRRLASIALLKIGYLLGFEKYGHIFLFNQNLDIVREQILHPEKELINEPFVLNHKFPKQYEGVNIINKPKELNCFLNTFVLKTKSKEIQISVIFPGYYEKDENFYSNIKSQLSSKKEVLNMEITTLEPLLNLKDENKISLPLSIWKS